MDQSKGVAFSRAGGVAAGPVPMGHTAADVRPVGIVLILLLVWQMLELGRPPMTPPGIQLVISMVLFLDWVFKSEKQLDRQSAWWFVLLAVTGLGVLFAPNTYAAGFSTRWMLTLFLGVCLPLQALIASPKQLQWWLYGFLAVALYANGWAASHGGFGPSGVYGGQDENYMAALAGMAIPFAYFALFVEKRVLYKTLLAVVIVVSIAAIALAQNPSRGGFIGLCVVGLYCLARSPRKWLGVGILVLAAAALAAIAGPEFWAEIKTSGDIDSGTADVRIEIWKAGLRMWQANPIFGVGAGNFRWVIADYQTAEQFEKFGRSLGGSIIAHSMHVELAAELGSAGIAATGMLVWNTWKGLGRVRDAIPAGPVHRDLALLRCIADATRASILAILVNGVFLSLLYYAHLWLLLAVGNAVPFVYRRVVAKSAVGNERAASPMRWRPGVVDPAAWRALTQRPNY